jgi:hypothetical protein
MADLRRHGKSARGQCSAFISSQEPIEQLAALITEQQLLAAAVRVSARLHQGKRRLNPAAVGVASTAAKQSNQPGCGGTWQGLALLIRHRLLQLSHVINASSDQQQGLCGIHWNASARGPQVRKQLGNTQQIPRRHRQGIVMIRHLSVFRVLEPRERSELVGVVGGS